MGLEALSDADLMALKSGDLTKVSDAGLMALKQPSAPVTNSPAPTTAPTMRQQIIENLVPLARPGGIGAEIGRNLDKAAYKTGEFVNDQAAKILPEKIAAGLGLAANVGVQAIPMMVGGGAGATAAPAMQEGARGFMQSALKPILGQLKTGKAARAIDTLLKEGVNVDKGGMVKLRGMIDDLNREIMTAIGNSPATVDKNKVASTLFELTDRLKKQVNPSSDLKAVDAAWNGFMNHPLLVGLDAKGAELAQTIAQKTAAKNAALQDAGRYQTMAAQQENLAHGGGVNRARGGTPLNEPYINVGSETLGGGRALSPSAYPVAEGMIGQPRIPGRYTENIQRVPEAKSAAEDFLKVVELRKSELAAAQAALREHVASGGGGIPVKLAQEMKQGTYRALGEKNYGELKGAEIEAQKALARGLKTEIADAVPGIANLNKAESELINALSVTERRVLMDANKNIAGLSLLAHSPAAWAAFMADRSPLFKSLIARAMYSGSEAIPATAGRVVGGAFGAMSGQPSPLYNQGAQ